MFWGFIGISFACGGTGISLIAMPGTGFWGAMGWVLALGGLFCLGVALRLRKAKPTANPPVLSRPPTIGILDEGIGNVVEDNLIIGADIGVEQRGSEGIAAGNRIRGPGSQTGALRLEDDAPESNVYLGAGSKRVDESGDLVPIDLRVLRIPFFNASTSAIKNVAAVIEVTNGTDQPVRGHGRWHELGEPNHAEIAGVPPAMGLARPVDFPLGPQRRALEVLVQEQEGTRLISGWHVAKDPRTWALTELVGLQQGQYYLRITLTGEEFEQQFTYDLTIPPDDAQGRASDPIIS
jgi:hypothetical protein